MSRRSLRKTLAVPALVLAIAGAAWLAVYAWNSGFTSKWRRLIATELARHGLRAEISRLTLDPIEGLTARGVKLYDMTHRDMHLADISSISLDIDMARLINEEEFLRTVTLNRANVLLPVDPADPHSRWLDIRELSARLVLQDRRIEIARAEGVVSGVRVSARGTVRKLPPVPADRRGSPKRREAADLREPPESRSRQEGLQTLLRVLESLRIPRGEDPERVFKAEVDLDFSGDLADPEKLEIRASLHAGPLVCGNSRLEELTARASLSAGTLSLHSLHLRDRQGEAHASASWPLHSSSIPFSLESTADLPGLLAGLVDERWLKEVVFYSAPAIRMEGTWDTSRPFSWSDPPVDVTGRLDARRFLSRGTVFEGLETDFAVRSGEFAYLRNTVISHRSGSARGQVLVRRDGVRYGLESTLRPEAVLKFLPDPRWRRMVSRLECDDRSRVLVQVDGEFGEGEWIHRGRFDVREARWNGMSAGRMAAEVTVRGETVSLKDPVIERPDGSVTAEAVESGPQGIIRIRNGVSAVPLPEVARLLPGAWQAAAQACRFEHSPHLEFHGAIDLSGSGRDDFHAVLESSGGCSVTAGGREWTARDVAGSLHAASGVLTAQLAGGLPRRNPFAGLLELPPATSLRFEGAVPLHAEAGPEFRVRLAAPGASVLRVAGHPFPVSGLEAVLTGDGSAASVRATGGMLNGRMEAQLQFADPASCSHTGDIRLERVSFPQLSRVLGESAETGGTAAGRFQYSWDDGTATLTGDGTCRVDNGNLFALPLLNRLANAVTAILPDGKPGRRVAPDATAAFRSRDGVIEFTGFEATTSDFTIIASGRVDIPGNRVELQSAIHLRAPREVAPLAGGTRFEYLATGTLTDPGWRLQLPPAPPPKRSGGP